MDFSQAGMGVALSPLDMEILSANSAHRSETLRAAAAFIRGRWRMAESATGDLLIEASMVFNSEESVRVGNAVDHILQMAARDRHERIDSYRDEQRARFVVSVGVREHARDIADCIEKELIREQRPGQESHEGGAIT